MASLDWMRIGRWGIVTFLEMENLGIGDCFSWSENPQTPLRRLGHPELFMQAKVNGADREIGVPGDECTDSSVGATERKKLFVGAVAIGAEARH